MTAETISTPKDEQLSLDELNRYSHDLAAQAINKILGKASIHQQIVREIFNKPSKVFGKDSMSVDFKSKKYTYRLVLADLESDQTVYLRRVSWIDKTIPFTELIEMCPEERNKSKSSISYYSNNVEGVKGDRHTNPIHISNTLQTVEKIQEFINSI